MAKLDEKKYSFEDDDLDVNNMDASSREVLSTLERSMQKSREMPTFGFKGILLTSIASICCVVLLTVGIVWGVSYNKSIKKIDETVELINYIPDGVTDYEYYEELIIQAYESYSQLSEKEKTKVENREKLLTAVAPYNEYKVAQLRAFMEQVTMENNDLPTALLNTAELYKALTSEQKTLLDSEEIDKLDSYVKVQDVVTLIDQINGDLINKYDQVSEVRKMYYSIASEYTCLIYNYDLVDTFDEKIEFYGLFTFELLSNETYSIKITDPESLAGDIELPASYNGKNVTAIPKEAFKGCSKITSIIIPTTVTSIGENVFVGCNRLESIMIPFLGKNVDEDGKLSYLFGGANVPQSLKTVTVTNQRRVANSAFANCKYLERVSYEKDVNYIGESCFSGCELLVSFNSTEIGTVDLSGSIEEIGTSAFQNCESITHIVFSEETLVIGNYAFSGCKNIEELNLTNRITTIGRYAFQNLKKITSVKVHNSTELIGVGAFQGCDSMLEIEIPFVGRTKNSESYEAVFGFIFGYDTKNNRVNANYSTSFINEQVGVVEGSTWQYSCYDFDDYYYGNGLQSYFYHIPNVLTKVTVTNQTDVKAAAFNGCKNITEITFVSEFTSISNAAFQNCSSLLKLNSNADIDINISGTYKTIGDMAFRNCVKIDRIIIPSGVVSIGKRAFENLSITSLAIPNTVETINYAALQGCNKLANVSVPFVGKSQSSSAYEAVFGFIFGYDTKNNRVNANYSTSFINEQVGVVEGSTWQYSCYDFDDYYYGNGLQSYFYHIPSVLTKVTITNQVNVPTAAFNGCTMLMEITFTKGIKSQGQCAFQNCPATIYSGTESVEK